MLCTKIAIAAKCHIFTFYAYDAVKDKASVIDLRQDRIAHLWVDGFGQQSLVAIILQKRPHGKAFQSQGDSVAFVKQSDNLW